MPMTGWPITCVVCVLYIDMLAGALYVACVPHHRGATLDQSDVCDIAQVHTTQSLPLTPAQTTTPKTALQSFQRHPAATPCPAC